MGRRQGGGKVNIHRIGVLASLYPHPLQNNGKKMSKKLVLIAPSSFMYHFIDNVVYTDVHSLSDLTNSVYISLVCKSNPPLSLKCHNSYRFVL